MQLAESPHRDVVDDSETAVQTWTRVAKGSLGRLGIAKGDGR